VVTVCFGNSGFKFLRETGFNFDDCKASRADEVMVVGGAFFLGKFETGDPISKIKTFYKSHFFEKVQRSVNGCEITLALRHTGMDLFTSEGMSFVAQDA